MNYLRKVPFKDVKKAYEKSFVGMELLSYNPSFGYKICTLGNTKLFDYMETGIPMVCADFILWKEKSRKIIVEYV